MNRRTRAGLILGALAAAPVLLWWVSTASVSPEQRIADAEPPPAPMVSGEVEERTLEDVVVFRGTAVAVGDLPVQGPDLGEVAPVVIDVPVGVGDQVEAGSVVAVVADRPVIVMPMSAPLYRTLTPGMDGPDIARLQDGLDEIGHTTPDSERGRFGPETQAAISEFYDDLGYDPAPTGAEAADAAAAAQDAYREATNALEDAQAALDQQRAALQDARAAAQQASAAAASAAQETASTEVAATSAPSPEDEKGGDVEGAADDGEDAADGEPANDDSAPEPAAPDGQQVEELQRAVREAERAVERARTAVAAAGEARDAAAARVGITLPVGEVVGVGDLPAVVSGVGVARGDVVADQPILTLATSELEVHATVEPSLASLLAPGTAANAGDEEWALEVLSNDSRTEDGDPFVRLVPEQQLPAEALGQDLRIEARLGGTDGPVLAVPVTAIRTDADGDHVRVVVDNGEVERVPVTTGQSLGGWVELVDPAADLTPGTTVRLG